MKTLLQVCEYCGKNGAKTYGVVTFEGVARYSSCDKEECKSVIKKQKTENCKPTMDFAVCR